MEVDVFESNSFLCTYKPKCLIMAGDIQHKCNAVMLVVSVQMLHDGVD